MDKVISDADKLMQYWLKIGILIKNMRKMSEIRNITKMPHGLKLANTTSYYERLTSTHASVSTSTIGCGLRKGEEKTEILKKFTF